MREMSILILYSLPAPFFSNGSPDLIGRESVISRLHAVQEALRSLGHSVETLEAKEDLSSFLRRIISAKTDLIFNLCEEFRGQTQFEMNVAALLELLGIPFTGSSAFVLGLSQDKGKTKSILAHHGIPTAAYRVLIPGSDSSVAGLQFPLIVKPLREDGGLGIDNNAFVLSEKEFKQQVQRIHEKYVQPALVEEYIDGRELNVSIIGNEEPEVLPISEIDFSTLPPGLPKICGYTAKWVEGSEEFIHTVPRCPAHLPPKIEKKVREVSFSSYRIIECRDYGRVDVRLSPEGTPYVLEVNANPDISPDAGMTRSAKNAGFTYATFIGRIVELAWARSRSAHRAEDRGQNA